MRKSEALRYRQRIETAMQSLPDSEALEVVTLYPEWDPTAVYAAGTRVQSQGVLYKCLLDHTAQANWTPGDAHNLWAKVLIPDPGAVPAWEQPDSTNAYMTGDRVTHDGKTWASDVDNNVWEPGVYGWTEVAA